MDGQLEARVQEGGKFSPHTFTGALERPRSEVKSRLCRSGNHFFP